MIYTQLYEQQSCSIVPCTAIVQRGLRHCSYNRPLKSVYQDFIPLFWYVLKQAGYVSFSHKFAIFLETELQKVSASEYQLPIFLTALEQLRIISPSLPFVCNGFYKPAIRKWVVVNDFLAIRDITINASIIPNGSYTTEEIISLINGNRLLESLPIMSPLLQKQHCLFINSSSNTIQVANESVVSHKALQKWIKRFLPELLSHEDMIISVVPTPKTIEELKEIPSILKMRIPLSIDLKAFSDNKKIHDLFDLTSQFQMSSWSLTLFERTPNISDNRATRLYEIVKSRINLFDRIQYSNKNKSYKEITLDQAVKILTL
jgi:hypothetical protein